MANFLGKKFKIQFFLHQHTIDLYQLCLEEPHTSLLLNCLSTHRSSATCFVWVPIMCYTIRTTQCYSVVTQVLFPAPLCQPIFYTVCQYKTCKSKFVQDSSHGFLQFDMFSQNSDFMFFFLLVLEKYKWSFILVIKYIYMDSFQNPMIKRISCCCTSTNTYPEA